MNRFLSIVPVVIGAVIIIPRAADTSATPPVLKCQPDMPILFEDAPEPAYVLDGRASDADTVQALAMDSIESVAIMCADELFELFGVKARRNGVVVFTKPGPASQANAALDRIAELQQAHHRQHGAYTADPQRLGWSDPDGLLTVALEAQGGSGWKAVLSHRYLPKQAFERAYTETR